MKSVRLREERSLCGWCSRYKKIDNTIGFCAALEDHPIPIWAAMKTNGRKRSFVGKNRDARRCEMYIKREE